MEEHLPEEENIFHVSRARREWSSGVAAMFSKRLDED